jgi:hypothetical protein
MIFDLQGWVKVSVRVKLSDPWRTCLGFDPTKQILRREGLRLDNCLEQFILS